MNVRLLRLCLAMTVSGQELVISNQKSKVICHREAVFFCHREAKRPWRSYINVGLLRLRLAMTLSYYRKIASAVPRNGQRGVIARSRRRRGNHVIARGRSPRGNLIYITVRLLHCLRNDDLMLL